MRYYTEENRGTIQKEEYAKQLVSFEGMRFAGSDGFNNVTPTDIDGFIQLDTENCMIFIELKYAGDVPTGQARALKKLCDAVEAGGVNSVAFVAEHKTPHPQTITAKDAVVKKMYWKGEWRWLKEPLSLAQITRFYIDVLRNVKA